MNRDKKTKTKPVASDRAKQSTPETRIRFDGEIMRIDFSGGFDSPECYELFKRAKRLPEYRVECSDGLLADTITAPARFAGMMGVEAPMPRGAGVPMGEFLYDDQRDCVEMALAAKRFAIWKDCGLGKTYEQYEWARQVAAITGGRVLIVTLNGVVDQFIRMIAEKYLDDPPIVRLESREEMKRWCEMGEVAGGQLPVANRIAITNYEKFNHKTEAEQVVSELRHLAGFCLDESSRLKAGGGKQKWAIIKSARGIEYKLSATATPAPNELMEFASQASFLEKLRASSIADAAEQIMWTYFTRDSKTHRWTIKQHARAAFFEWMSSWSIYVRDPRKYGWKHNNTDRVWEPPPEPEFFTHNIAMTAEQREFVMDFNAKAPPPAGDESGTVQMFVGETNATTASKLSQAAKGFVYVKKPVASDRAKRIESRKPAFVADLIRKEIALGLQVLVWTEFDAEVDILCEELERGGMVDVPDFAFDVLTGSTKKADREPIIQNFRDGGSRLLITRTDLFGFGQNVQHCGSMIFNAWTFGYEDLYQAIRRAVRDGQTKHVRIHFPMIAELEGQMFAALERKQRQHEEAIAEMEKCYIAARETLTGRAS